MLLDLVYLPALLLALAAGVLLLGLLLARRRRRKRAPRTDVAAGPAAWVSGLAKTRRGLAARLLESWGGTGQIDAWLGEVEEILLGSDVGAAATRDLLEGLRLRAREVDGPVALRNLLKDTMRAVLAADGGEAAAASAKPEVIVVVGVNGVGKTTTIGKLAALYRGHGKRVLLVAADTFRAAASEQLGLWAERVQADLVKHRQGADPAAVVFDGIKAARARDVDVVIIDTAGRLHVKVNLMEELKKMVRIVARELPGAPHQTLLVIDATTGQNALSQARLFHEAIRISGVVLTKLDGTAKGGIILAIRKDLGLPILYVGLGERPEDLAPFDPDEFVEALFAEAGASA